MNQTATAAKSLLKAATRALLVAAAVGAAAIPAAAHADCLGMALHAHRGAPGAPENSTSAVQLALQGDWDGVEVDLQMLRDQAWVLHHDLQTTRTTSLQGRSVWDIDSQTWREVRLRDRQGKVIPEAPPFLAELLSQIPEDAAKVLNLEIKQTNLSCAPAQKLATQLQTARPAGQWFLTAVDRRQLQCIRKVDPEGYLGLIVVDPQALVRQARRSLSAPVKPPSLDMQRLKRLQAEVGAPVGVHVDVSSLSANPDLLNDARGLGIPVFTYHLGPDKAHAEALRTQARNSGLLPSGAIIDGEAKAFCAMVTPP